MRNVPGYRVGSCQYNPLSSTARVQIVYYRMYLSPSICRVRINIPNLWPLVYHQHESSCRFDALALFGFHCLPRQPDCYCIV